MLKSPLTQLFLADIAARVMRVGAGTALRAQQALPGGYVPRDRFPEYPGRCETLSIPNSVAPAGATLYRPPQGQQAAGIYVNFHGGGYIMPFAELDDPLCRYLAAEAGVAVLNVDYVVAPKYRFPDPPRQAYEVVRWAATHGDQFGWDSTTVVVGGQSSGGGLAAAVARQAFESGEPAIALQVLHYPPLDIAADVRGKSSGIDNPMIRPWMRDVFDTAYVPDPRQRADRLVSPAGRADTADLTGIAPALVITAENDVLRGEAIRYAQRLREVGALVEHIDVPGVDHAYDMKFPDTARSVYATIAAHVRAVTGRR